MVSVFYVLYPLSALFPISDAEDGGPVSLAVERRYYHVNKSSVLFTYFFREKLLYL